MKKLTTILCIASILFLYTACGAGDTEPGIDPQSQNENSVFSSTSSVSVPTPTDGTSVPTSSSSEFDTPALPVDEFELTRTWPGNTEEYHKLNYEEYFAEERWLAYNMGTDPLAPYDVNQNGQVINVEDNSVLHTLPKTTLGIKNYSYYYFIVDDLTLYVMDLYTGLSMPMYTATSQIRMIQCDEALSYLWLENGEIWRLHMKSKTADLFTVSNDVTTKEEVIFISTCNMICSWEYNVPTGGVSEEDQAVGFFGRSSLDGQQATRFRKSYHYDKGYGYITPLGAFYPLDEVTQEILDISNSP